MQLGVSESTLYRKIAKYSKEGIQGLVHGNSGKTPVNKMTSGLRSQIVQLLEERYLEFQPSLAKKYIKRDLQIEVSEEFIRRRLIEIRGSGAPRRVNQYTLRRRRSCFGELIQIDGSTHHWFGPDRPSCSLLAFIDDATGKITAAGFYPVEDTEGYLELISKHVLRYGVPKAFYSDRHSVFKANASDNDLGKTEVKTQYQRACEMLGITYIYARTPQAKGRIERLNRSLQGRWPKEFAVRGIKDINTANELIESFISEYNEEFEVRPLDEQDSHSPLSISKEDVLRICAKWHKRTLSKQLTFSFKNLIVQVLGVEGRQSWWFKTVDVIEYGDGKIEVSYGQRVLVTSIKKASEPKRFGLYEETSKTIDYRIDQIMAKENSRRAVWLNERAKKARKALDIRDELLTAALEVAQEDIDKLKK